MDNLHDDYSTFENEMQVFRVEPEFENKIPPIGEDEFRQLRENILAEGEVFEPLVVWNGVLVDGHNRWKVIRENPAIKYRVREMDFADKWAAFEWMYRNQLGRRNLTDEQRTYSIGKMNEARKNTSAFKGNQYTSESGGCQNGANQNRVAGQIASELGIGRRTVNRAAEFAKGVDALREVSSEAADKVLGGNSGVSKSVVQKIAHMEHDEVEDVAVEIMTGRKPERRVERRPRTTDEDRQNMAEIDAIIADMYDPTTTPEFTIDMLIEDIEFNANLYIEVLANTLTDRANLVTDENKPRIAAEINKVIDKIAKVRESM